MTSSDVDGALDAASSVGPVFVTSSVLHTGLGDWV